jgi:predicted nucleic acid-binding protein
VTELMSAISTRIAPPVLPLVRSFFDWNVLIYAKAKDEPVIKQKIALALLKHLHQSTLGVISTQVLQEYCNIGLKKLH